MLLNRELLDSLFKLSPTPMVLADLETGRQLLVNEAFSALPGRNGSPLDFNDLLPLEVSDRLKEALLEGQGAYYTKLFLPSLPDQEFRATLRLVENQNRRFILASLEAQTCVAREQFSQMAFRDSLTGLPNRSWFLDKLTTLVQASSGDNGKQFSVILLDLDRFKIVNDSLGHLYGDSLLIDIGRRLGNQLGSRGELARVGGDEFGILLQDYEKPGEALRLAHDLLASLDNPLELGGSDIHISASMGIVLLTGSYTSAQELLRDAGIALHAAKGMGKGRYKVFNRQMHSKALETMRMHTELRRALKKETFCLHYQPIVRLEDNKMRGLEVLLRWNHPQLGLITPVHFLGDAEETGMIVPIGEWVLREACTLLSQWREAGMGSDLFMNINISCRQLFHRRFLQSVKKILMETGLPPSVLKLEVTEHALLRDCKKSRDVLMRLKKLGVGLVIDDFGTGYSSLSYLRRFPFDCLKIDRSFISGQGGLRKNLPIVQAILALARALDLRVVAEGIEEEEQASLIAKLGCRHGQGFLFSRPLEAKVFESLL